MTVFEILNKAENSRLLGYLFYYEKSRRFYAELLDDIDEWEVPFIFSSHIKKGIHSIDSMWSAKFVGQRIIPPDRQNLGSILKENGLKVYDEYRLLLLSDGQCAQDDLRLARIREDQVSTEIKNRLNKKVLDVMTLDGFKILVFFKDGKNSFADIKKICKDDPLFGNVTGNIENFRNIKVSPGGHGIEWGEERFISAETLRKCSDNSEITYEDIICFIKTRMTDTAETAQMLNCSRQYVNQLTDKGRLSPVRSTPGSNLYLKSALESESYS